MVTDIVLAIIFTTAAASALFLKADKIEEWQNEVSNNKLNWRD